MCNKHVVLATCMLFAGWDTAAGQTNQNKLIHVLSRSAPTELATYTGPDVSIPSLAGNAALAESTIRNPANYRRDPLSVFLRPLNVGIATQLSALPIASPASAILLREDPTTGAVAPASQGLGPILTERAETIGKGRLYMGYTRQQFRFDELDGQPLGNFQMLSQGGEPSPISQAGPRNLAPVSVGTAVDLRINQDVAFFTYGLTNRIDVSTAITWGWSSISAISSNAQIQSNSASAGGNCWCIQNLNINRAIELNRAGQGGVEIYSMPGVLGAAQESASGIGDTLVRVKGTVIDRPRLAVAVGSDLRLPSGDAENYLGSGAVGFKPFTAISVHTGDMFGGFNIAPHFNLGYQVNGDSILAAADPTSGIKAGLPNQLNYAVGAEWGVRSFTVVTDYLGLRLIDANRVARASAQRVGSTETVTGFTLAEESGSFSMNSFAVGFKVKVIGNLVLTANTMIALDDNGLRDKVVPLFGLSYTVGR